MVHFFAGLYLKFDLGKSTYFKVISQAFLGDAKVRSETGGNMLNSRLMDLRISHGKYTLFSVNFFVGLSCLMLKFWLTGNLLDVLMEYEK